VAAAYPEGTVMTGAVKVVDGGLLLDGTGSSPIRDSVVVIEGTRIRDVGTRGEISIPDDVEVIPASGKTVMPGLIDAHFHLAGVIDPNEPNITLATLRAPSALIALHAAKHARETLEAGYTTVRDMAGQTNYRNLEILSLRTAIEIGLVPGPRVVVCGWVGQTAGHMDLGWPSTLPRGPYDTADGVWEVRKRVREFVRDGVDWIKTSASGGGTRSVEEPWWRNYTLDELTAICDEAHAVGKQVAVHSHIAENNKRAVLAGADTLEHGLPTDEDTIELMNARHVTLVPTLFSFSEDCIAGMERVWGGIAGRLDRYRALSEDARDWFRKCHRAGVRIAAGSDIYRTLGAYYGRNAIELEHLVRNGMSEMEAIVAATKVAAEAIGLEAVGTIQKGMRADLLLVDGDPIVDIRILQDARKLRMVMKDGARVVSR
jgi:imidazolonepropionase-like amidohydrolase